jgi:methylthioribose-1-phosphate isomerase
MRIDGRPYRTIWLADDGWSVEVIDQTRLPFSFETRTLRTLDQAAEAIATMVVRGAPLIGVTAAYGLCLALRTDPSDAGLERAAARLTATRPTAVNLRWALDRMAAIVRRRPPAERAAAAYAEAAAMADEDVRRCRAIGEHGAALIREAHERKGGDGPINILTHCNAGWLATVDWGTALAPIYVAHDAGIPVHVLVDETRPRNQGAALTAFELGAHGVPHTLLRRQRRRSPDAAREGGPVHRRLGPHHGRRRRGEQDRHLSQGARGQGQRRAVLRRVAVLDDRLGNRGRRAGHPDRGALGTGGHRT